MVKYKKKVEIGDVKVLKKAVSTFSVEFEAGDVVKVIDKGDRGYTLLHEPSGLKISECGWDLFEDEWVTVDATESELVVREYLGKSNSQLLSEFKWGSEGESSFGKFMNNVRRMLNT